MTIGEGGCQATNKHLSKLICLKFNHSIFDLVVVTKRSWSSAEFSCACLLSEKCHHNINLFILNKATIQYNLLSITFYIILHSNLSIVATSQMKCVLCLHFLKHDMIDIVITINGPCGYYTSPLSSYASKMLDSRLARVLIILVSISRHTRRQLEIQSLSYTRYRLLALYLARANGSYCYRNIKAPTDLHRPTLASPH